MARGETQNAIADIRVIAKLIPDSTETYLEISRMYYEVGDIENALTQIRECLKLNPDHKQCFPFYKRIKKLAKLRDELQKTVNAQKWMDCLAKGQEIMKFESEVDNVQLEVFRHTCRCNNKVFGRQLANLFWTYKVTFYKINFPQLRAYDLLTDFFVRSEKYDEK